MGRIVPEFRLEIQMPKSAPSRRKKLLIFGRQLEYPY